MRLTSMIAPIFAVALLSCAPVICTPALASIQGDYTGNFVTGVDTAAYSYVHAATTAKKMGDAGYYQNAGGQIMYAIDSAPSISFFFNDVGGDGLNDGDSLTFNNASVGILAHDGVLDNVNTGAPAGTLTLNGTLNIGGSHSNTPPTSFTHGINNITAADTDASHTGLFYTITSPGNIVLRTGEIFFQSGALAGPFNGIKYDDTTDTLTFAVWGSSLNKGGRETGVDSRTGGVAPLGFDIFINAELSPGPGTDDFVPEAASLAVWSLLVCLGLSSSRVRRIS